MNTLLDLVSEHSNLKQAILKEALGLLVGHPVFDERENAANKKIGYLLHQLKKNLPIEFYINPLKFKDIIESSDLYKAIKKAPKGSLHHVHLNCATPAEWV